MPEPTPADPAHVLFPNDAPKPSTPPDWFQSRQSAAEARLGGNHGQGQQAGKSSAGTGGNPASPAGPDDADGPDAAETLFKNDASAFDAKSVAEIFDGFANAAIGDNDGGERFRALETARDGLIADMKAHGADAKELADVMTVVKERQGDGLLPPTPEQAEQRMTESLAACRVEGITEADLNIARQFVSDLELIAPGTIDSLNRGAGNDLRIIRAAIKEGRRRGYK